MSAAPQRYRVFNNRDQPVELYYGSQVAIVPPWEYVELDENALAAAQIQALSEQRLITVVGPLPEESEAEQSTGTLEDPPELSEPPTPQAKSKGARRRDVTGS